MNDKILIFLFFISAFLISDCSAGHKTASDTNSINNKWTAESINGIKTDPTVYSDKLPFLTFDSEAGTVTGSTGCNILNGKFKIDGSGIKISEIITTKMFCAEIDEITFLDILKKADNYEIKDGKLNLYSGKDLKMVLVK